MDTFIICSRKPPILDLVSFLCQSSLLRAVDLTGVAFYDIRHKRSGGGRSKGSAKMKNRRCPTPAIGARIRGRLEKNRRSPVPVAGHKDAVLGQLLQWPERLAAQVGEVEKIRESPQKSICAVAAPHIADLFELYTLQRSDGSSAVHARLGKAPLEEPTQAPLKIEAPLAAPLNSPSITPTSKGPLLPGPTGPRRLLRCSLRSLVHLVLRPEALMV